MFLSSHRRQQQTTLHMATNKALISQNLFFNYPLDPTSPEQSPAHLFNAPDVFRTYFGDPNVPSQWPMGYNDLSTPPSVQKATVLMKVVSEQEALRRAANKVLEWFPMVEDDYAVKQMTVIEFKQGIAEDVAQGALGPQFKTLFTKTSQSTMGVKGASLQLSTSWFMSPVGRDVYWALVGVLKESFYNAQLIELWRKIHAMPIPKYMALATQYHMDTTTGDGSYMQKQQIIEKMLEYRIKTFNISHRFSECLEVLFRMVNDEQPVWNGIMDSAIIHSKIGRAVQMIKENNRNSEVGQFPVEAGGVRNNLGSLETIQNVSGSPIRIQPPVKIENNLHDFLEFVEIFGEYFQLPLDGGHVEVFDGDTDRMEKITSEKCIDVINENWDTKGPKFLKEKHNWFDIYKKKEDDAKKLGGIWPDALKDICEGIFEIACKGVDSFFNVRSKYTEARKIMERLSANNKLMNTGESLWTCFKAMADQKVAAEDDPSAYIGGKKGMEKWCMSLQNFSLGSYNESHKILSDWWVKASKINENLKTMLSTDSDYMDFFSKNVHRDGENANYDERCLRAWMKDATSVSVLPDPMNVVCPTLRLYDTSPVPALRGTQFNRDAAVPNDTVPARGVPGKYYDWISILGDCPFHAVNDPSLREQFASFTEPTKKLVAYIMEKRRSFGDKCNVPDALVNKMQYKVTNDYPSEELSTNRKTEFNSVQFHTIVQYMESLEGMTADKKKTIDDYAPLPIMTSPFDVVLLNTFNYRNGLSLAAGTAPPPKGNFIHNIKDAENVIEAMILDSEIQKSLVSLSKKHAPLPVGILCARSNIAVLTHGVVFLARNRTLKMVKGQFRIGVEVDSVGDNYLINAHLKTGVEEMPNATSNLWVIPNVSAEKHIRGETTLMKVPGPNDIYTLPGHNGNDGIDESVILRPYLIPYGYIHHGPLDLANKYFTEKCKTFLDLWIPSMSSSNNSSWEINRRPISTATFPDHGYDSDFPPNTICYLAPHWCFSRNGEKKNVIGYGHWKTEIGDGASEIRYINGKHPYLITPLSINSEKSHYYHQ